MRNQLKKYENMRLTFTARVGRKGTRINLRNQRVETICLEDIKLKDEYICDHAWKSLTTCFVKSGCELADIIEFDATVKAYRKGDMGQYIDYKLDRLSNITIVKKARYQAKSSGLEVLKLIPVGV